MIKKYTSYNIIIIVLDLRYTMYLLVPVTAISMLQDIIQPSTTRANTQ